MTDTGPHPVLEAGALEASRLLIGMSVHFRGLQGRIIEVEAYTEDDPASHSYRGKNPRNTPMFLSAGHIYVYRSYGVHWCLNLVTGPQDQGEAVLIRALRPELGIAQMRLNRGMAPDSRLCLGPGNVCAALGIDGSLSGTRLGRELLLSGEPGKASVKTSPRVGISVATDLPWRFSES